jgi:hypothetical protein
MQFRTYPTSSVSEIQGLYGPLQVLEGKVQQVWALQQIQKGAWRTRSGRTLRVKSPGIWNRGAGPDFKEAVIEVDGEPRVGDVELHLYREDWWRHGHDADPAFNGVVLHVVLFAGGMDRPIRTAGGRLLEEWIMGPWMREDLESVTGGEPGLFGELVPELREWIEADPPETVRTRLKAGADRRWQDKVSMARCLLETHGWGGGLHRMVLFYLGFPFNRRPFYAMAEAYPMEAWCSRGLLKELRTRWADTVKWGLGRPANRAETRLRQYLDLNKAVPDWAERLALLPSELAARAGETGDAGTPRVRRHARLTDWDDWLTKTVLGDCLNDSLRNRLWIDVFLPLLAVGADLPGEVAAILWVHARPGPFPDAYRPMLGLAGIGVSRELPHANGWIQGLYWAEEQLRLERIRRSVGAGPGAEPSRA